MFLNFHFYRGETFRPTFARLGELRSHFPCVPFLMLTATCTQHILKQITTRIYLPNLKMYTASPDRYLSIKIIILLFKDFFFEKYKHIILIIYRPNIYLECKRATDIFKELNWLFQEVKEKGIKARKTLIYVR